MNFLSMNEVASNSSVYINIANRLVGLLGNLGVVAVVIFMLDVQMQGFYYTFYSLVFLKFFAELGLSFAVVQIISHLASTPERSEDLKSHTWFFTKWFAIASLLLGLVLMPAILIFEEQYTEIENYDQRIVLPWLVLSISTCASVFLNGMVSVIEGHKKILSVSKIRLAQSAANIVVVITCLIAGLELWSLALGAVAGITSAAWGISKFYSLFKVDAMSKQRSVDWKGEIWPFQWRLGASWVSGFFIFYSLTPIVLRFVGPEAAGQLGMSLQLFQAINSIGILFVSTHSAVFGGLIAQKRTQEMEKKFITCSIKSTIFLTLLLIIFWLSKMVSDYYFYDTISIRILENSMLLIVMIACLCNHVFFMMNYFFRCFKAEALWLLSIINSISTIGLALIFVPIGGVFAATAIYAGNAFLFWIIIGVPYCLHWRHSLVKQQEILQRSA
ncbi:lipopolysaccharide biosynthesis protein [Alterisphingorhabdus coralli]|uniref:Polysaccharide biosynthesis protein n=1 Tax=Alterisphingorhabdus coralli TaxID=3071408 RepID=A0AA97F973_9SPHN|nr:hypothetical protein [Parasphingorhabdus sp. SCSIO 66989]WOE74800.1 hypothetical protein RB602_13275 [Parasphingorhabdus sp. SCSIO 66989]